MQTILTMSGQLGLHTVAEGIERDVQAQALTSLGCTVGQGYLFSRPMDPDEIAALLAAQPDRPTRHRARLRG